MKVLMISTDRNILVPGSAVSERMKEYGGLVERLDIILLSDRSHGLKETELSKKVRVFPTNSLNKFLRPINAVQIGRKIDCSIITTQDPFECGWAGMKLKRVKKVPLEVQLHTDPSSPHFSGFLNWIRKQMMKMVMKHADGVRDVANLPIYVDRSRIEGEPEFDLHERFGFKYVILMVTRLAKEKNINLALEAFAKVRVKFPEAGLVIVGSGPEKFEAQDGVVFAGWQDDLASYYKTADVFVQTSVYEGYGLSLVEAGLSGLPVVSTPVGIAARLKDVRVAHTPDEFARAIESAINSPKTADLKQELETIVLTKEMYLSKIKENWEKTASTKI